MNTGVQTSLQVHGFSSVLLGIYPRSRIAGSYVILHLIFWGTTILFSIMAALFYVPNNLPLKVLVYSFYSNYNFQFYLSTTIVWEDVNYLLAIQVTDFGL